MIKKRTLPAFLMLVAFACLVTGCVSPVRDLFPAPPGQTPRTIYVLHYGIHTGVIVRTADIPSGVWPEHREFPDAEYLEAGWGDSQGYRYPLTCRIALRAMFASKGSVVFIHAFSGSVTNEYDDVAKEIVAVQLSRQGFARLCGYVQDTYALDPLDRPIPVSSSYSQKTFYQARGHYSAVNNCNNWTARALRKAGCPIRPWRSFLPGIVMRRCGRFGVEVLKR